MIRARSARAIAFTPPRQLQHLIGAADHLSTRRTRSARRRGGASVPARSRLRDIIEPRSPSSRNRLRDVEASDRWSGAGREAVLAHRRRWPSSGRTDAMWPKRAAARRYPARSRESSDDALPTLPDRDAIPRLRGLRREDHASGARHSSARERQIALAVAQRAGVEHDARAALALHFRKAAYDPTVAHTQRNARAPAAGACTPRMERACRCVDTRCDSDGPPFEGGGRRAARRHRARHRPRHG